MSNPLLDRLHALGGWDDVADWYGEDAADFLLELAMVWAVYPESRKGAERKFQDTLRALDLG